MKHEMTAVAFLGLIARGRFAHGVVGRRAAVLSVGFDAVPFNHEHEPARIFDAGEKFNAVGAGVVALFRISPKTLMYSSRFSGSTC